jgi:nitrilase
MSAKSDPLFPERFVAAAVQCSPVFLDMAGTIEKIEGIVKTARDNGAELIGFPEALISTYPYWVWMQNPFKWRRKFTQRFYENSLDLDGPSTKRLCDIAGTYGCYLVVGANEKVGGTIYNSQLFISEKGKLEGVHRKLIPTFAERSIWGRGDGSTLRTFKTKFGILGGLICAEHNMPLTRYALLGLSEEIHVASFPAFPFKNAVLPYQADIAVRNHAIEGQVFVINSSSYLSPEMINSLCDTDEERELLSDIGNGFSCIINPLGFYLGGPLTNQEGIVYAEIDKKEIREAKRTLDAVGHYSRPDILRLQFNRGVQENLVDFRFSDVTDDAR